MADTHTIEAKGRSDTGKGASRRLRRTGLVPGIVYGADMDPEMFSVEHHKLVHELEDEAFYSSILELSLDGKKQKVVLKDLQRHPAKPFVTHLDLMRIRADEEIKMLVPLHFIGEESSPGVKAGATASHNMTEIEISCLPGNLPEYIEVDVSTLDIGDALHLSDIKLPEGVEIPALALGEDHDTTVINVIASRASTEDEEIEEVAGEGEGEAVPEEDKE